MFLDLGIDDTMQDESYTFLPLVGVAHRMENRDGAVTVLKESGGVRQHLRTLFRAVWITVR